MDRRSFWPQGHNRLDMYLRMTHSIHHKTDDLPKADRRIQSRMEDPKEFNPNQQMVNSNREQLQRADESQYKSLRRPRVRVDLRENQSDRRKRQRRSCSLTHLEEFPVCSLGSLVDDNQRIYKRGVKNGPPFLLFYFFFFFGLQLKKFVGNIAAKKGAQNEKLNHIGAIYYQF